MFTPITGRTAGIVLAGLLAAVSAFGLYRGDEYTQRDYPIDSEYYVDYLPLLPKIEHVLAYREQTNAILAVGGSYTKNELFIMNNLKLQTAFVPPTRLGFEFEQNQDFDDVYWNYFLSADYPLDQHWAIGVVGQPFARKEFSDIGLQVLGRGEKRQMRLQAMFPNFAFTDKNDMDGSFARQPVCFRADAYRPLNDRLEGYVKADLDFPSETDYDKPRFDFNFQSYKPTAGLIWHVATQRVIWSECNYEYTKKEETGSLPDGINDFTTDRSFYNARVEYVRTCATPGRRWTAGLYWVYLDEDNEYPYSPTNTFHLRHMTRMAYGTYTEPLSDRLLLNTGIYMDFVDHEESRPYREQDSYRHDLRWEGKVPFGLEWTARNYGLWLAVSMQLDAIAFGGGSMGLRAVF